MWARLIKTSDKPKNNTALYYKFADMYLNVLFLLI